MYAMKTRVILILILILATVASCSSAIANPIPQPTPGREAGAAAVGSAETVVADLYRAHKSKTRDPFFNSKSRASLDKYFVKSLADLIWHDSVTSAKNNEVGVIDGDPLYNAQDMEIKNFAVGRATTKGNDAIVPVTFSNFGKKETIKFNMKRVGGVWKVDDIDYGGEEGTLRKWFKDAAAAEKHP